MLRYSFESMIKRVNKFKMYGYKGINRGVVGVE